MHFFDCYDKLVHFSHLKQFSSTLNCCLSQPTAFHNLLLRLTPIYLNYQKDFCERIFLKFQFCHILKRVEVKRSHFGTSSFFSRFLSSIYTCLMFFSAQRTMKISLPNTNICMVLRQEQCGTSITWQYNLCGVNKTRAKNKKKMHVSVNIEIEWKADYRFAPQNNAFVIDIFVLFESNDAKQFHQSHFNNNAQYYCFSFSVSVSFAILLLSFSLSHSILSRFFAASLSDRSALSAIVGSLVLLQINLLISFILFLAQITLLFMCKTFVIFVR